MKISELRDFLNNLPEEIAESYQIIYRKFEAENDSVIFLDYPLSSLYIDEENDECIFLDEDGWDFFNNNLLLSDDSENNEE
jgi:hypothetical protein